MTIFFFFQNTVVQETTNNGEHVVEISNKTARVRTKYHVVAGDRDMTRRWFSVLHRHIANMGRLFWTNWIADYDVFWPN